VSGARSYHAGVSAEERVAAHYERAGCTIRARRWTCAAGEIDLVIADGEVLVFVEVKAARSHARAAERIGQRQAARILRAAEAFVSSEPAGASTEMRFDVALVDGTGRVEVIENALTA
jgi:putative endonuclease